MPANPSPASPWRDRLATWLVPCVLVAVAVVQIVRVHTLDQSSWSGIGFGMFATIDNEDSRFVRGVAIAADGTETLLDLPTDLERQAFEAATVPSDRRARDLARAWYERLDPPPPQLRIEVWGVDLVGREPALEPRHHAEVVHP